MQIAATRLLDAPIIAPGMAGLPGSNINGPALLPMPDWAPGLAPFHLYFADHRGRHIRLALADRPEGPWRIHPGGVLDVADSGFVAAVPDRDSLDPGSDWARALDAAAGDALYPHVASPDVHADAATRRILMYFHGLLPGGAQGTRLAVSRDGVRFEVLEPVLGPPYFRVFRHGGATFALAWGAELLRAPGWGGPFERGPQLFGQRLRHEGWTGPRHVAVSVAGERLRVFYSAIGDAPERIRMAEVALAGDWRGWRAGPPVEVLRPERGWEGAGLPVAPSRMGAADAPECALRDPDVVRAPDGRWLMLYACAGESGIGIAELSGI